MSCNDILIWKQWDSNLDSNVTGNHILIVLNKESFWMRYMYSTCISPNPQPTTVNYYTNYIVQFISNLWELCLCSVL